MALILHNGGELLSIAGFVGALDGNDIHELFFRLIIGEINSPSEITRQIIRVEILEGDIRIET